MQIQASNCVSAPSHPEVDTTLSAWSPRLKCAEENVSRFNGIASRETSRKRVYYLRVFLCERSGTAKCDLRDGTANFVFGGCTLVDRHFWDEVYVKATASLEMVTCLGLQDCLAQQRS